MLQALHQDYTRKFYHADANSEQDCTRTFDPVGANCKFHYWVSLRRRRLRASPPLLQCITTASFATTTTSSIADQVSTMLVQARARA